MPVSALSSVMCSSIGHKFRYRVHLLHRASPSPCPTSRIAPLAAMVPKVMICATWSAPYFCYHIVNDLLASFIAEINIKVRHS